jgi:hypothetical protein
MLDTKVGAAKKDNPADVASDGFKAMRSGEGGVVSGWQNKLEAEESSRSATPTGEQPRPVPGQSRE